MERLKSRKFWFAAVWTGLVVFGMVVSLVVKAELSFMGQLITFAGTVTAAYVGVQGWADGKK